MLPALSTLLKYKQSLLDRREALLKQDPTHPEIDALSHVLISLERDIKQTKYFEELGRINCPECLGYGYLHYSGHPPERYSCRPCKGTGKRIITE